MKHIFSSTIKKRIKVFQRIKNEPIYRSWVDNYPIKHEEENIDFTSRKKLSPVGNKKKESKEREREG